METDVKTDVEHIISVQDLLLWGNKNEEFCKEASEKHGYSARVIHKLLRLARTAADLRGAETISREDIIFVLGCRDLDKSNSDMYIIK